MRLPGFARVPVSHPGNRPHRVRRARGAALELAGPVAERDLLRRGRYDRAEVEAPIVRELPGARGGARRRPAADEPLARRARVDDQLPQPRGRVVVEQ
jgi:hypothetical protein